MEKKKYALPEGKCLFGVIVPKELKARMMASNVKWSAEVRQFIRVRLEEVNKDGVHESREGSEVASVLQEP